MFEAGNTEKSLANLIEVWIYFKFIYFCRDFFCIKLATMNPYKGDTPKFVDNEGKLCRPALCH